MIDHFSLVYRREHSDRHAHENPEDYRNRRQFQRRREEADNVLAYLSRSHDRLAEIALKNVREIDHVLHDQRLIEAELQAHGVIYFGRGSITDDGKHRVSRHNPTDDECDGGEADESEKQG